MFSNQSNHTWLSPAKLVVVLGGVLFKAQQQRNIGFFERRKIGLNVSVHRYVPALPVEKGAQLAVFERKPVPGINVLLRKINRSALVRLATDLVVSESTLALKSNTCSVVLK